jgi:hypothetical protein
VEAVVGLEEKPKGLEEKQDGWRKGGERFRIGERLRRHEESGRERC